MAMKNRYLRFNESELLAKICDISEIKSMKVAVSSSLKSGILVGAATTLGALLLGPRGIAIGGLISGLGASYMMDGTFKSVPDIIMNEATEEQRRALFQDLINLLSFENIFSMSMLIMRLNSGDMSLVNELVQLIKKFLEKNQYQFYE